jgi:hypothetical protein
LHFHIDVHERVNYRRESGLSPGGVFWRGKRRGKINCFKKNKFLKKKQHQIWET